MGDFLKTSKRLNSFGQADPLPSGPCVVGCLSSLFKDVSRRPVLNIVISLSGTHLLALATCIFLCDISGFCVGQDLTWLRSFPLAEVSIHLLCLPPVE